jgi:hypothetical protein
MEKEYKYYVFEFSGSTERIRYSGENAYQLPPVEISQGPTRIEEPTDKEAIIGSEEIATLNYNATQIAQDIEKEISRIFRSSATAQAEIRFYEGSIIIEGTIMIMSWLGPIAFAAGTKALESVLSDTVEVAIKRVLQQAFRKLGISAEPVRKIDVNPQGAPVTEPSQPAKVQQTNEFQILPVLTVTNTIILMLLLIIQLVAVLSR